MSCLVSVLVYLGPGIIPAHMCPKLAAQLLEGLETKLSHAGTPLWLYD